MPLGREAQREDERGDHAGQDAAGLVLALSHGLLLQVLLDPTLAIDGDRMRQAQLWLPPVLPDPPRRRGGAADRRPARSDRHPAGRRIARCRRWTP